MKKTESIEKDALTEMMSPSVSPSAARDAEVKKSVELALQDYTPKNGIADTLGRMHSDAQFAGSSSVPAHVEMMGFLGMGNNPMVGATVAVAVAIQQAMTE